MKAFWETYHVLIVILTIATALCFVWLFVFNRKKLNASWWEILIVCLLHTLVGVGFVKFFALLEAGFVASKAGNMSMFGGIFFMPIFYYVYAKIKKLPVGLVFDIFTVSLVITLMLARINCLFMGCCTGRIIGYTEKRYATREAELVYDALFLGLAIYCIFKNKFANKIYLIYLSSYGLFRFICEIFRESISGTVFHIAHVWAGLSILIGVTLLIVMNYLEKEKQRNAPKKKKNK